MTRSSREPEELLAALDPDQQEVALQVTGPLSVRAGAGTGKTRAITYRIAYGAATGAVDPSTVLAVTFTSKAAAEMRARLRVLGAGSAQAMTFHAAALKQLSYFWPRVTGASLPTLIPHKAGLVASAAARVGLSTDKSVIRDLSAEIEWAKVSMTGPEGYADYAKMLGRSVPLDQEPEQFARFYEAYEEAKDDRGGIDFEDVLSLMSGMIASDERVAKQVRSRYRSFVVDEYQDVSPAQQHLLDLWRGDRTDLCVVGDVAQTIYSFAGADAKYLDEFPKKMRGARVVELVRDYRSTPQVVAVANQIVAAARGFDGTKNQRGIPGAVRLVAQQPSGPAVSFTSYETDQDEAQGVVESVVRLRARGMPLSEISVLYRTNAQSQALEERLLEAGIPFQLHGAARFFEREEVKRALVLLRQQARLAQLGAGGAEPDNALLADQVEAVVSTLGWTRTTPKTLGAVRDRWANLDALVSLAKRREDLTLGAFVEELMERAEAKASPEIDGVVLSTLHAAKGLEWTAVHLIGVCEGLLPISLAQGPSAVEEERRLLYVGVTRAKEELFISYAKSRGGGRSHKRKVSRFLEGMWPHNQPTAPAKKTARRSTKDQNADFEATSDETTLRLFKELRVWRTETARQDGRPAFTVFADATLRDIARAKPRTLRQLGVLRGVGPRKLDQYGSDVLGLVRSFLEV